MWRSINWEEGWEARRGYGKKVVEEWGIIRSEWG
jgi:hypothetical protein